MAQPFKWTNTGLSTLASGIDAVQTTLTVATGTGSRFPVDSFNVVIWNSTDFANPIDAADREIVKCTSRAGDVLTIVRGQEGTTGVTHNTAGKTYSVALAITKVFLDDLAVIPSGTVMVFFQAAAPTGWTQVTTQSDKALRVVGGVGGGAGGTRLLSAATVGSTVLTVTQMPSHTHVERGSTGGAGGDIGMERRANDSGASQASVMSTNSSGGNAEHDHALALAFINIILASKD